MVKIVVYTIDDFLKAMERVCTPQTHIVVTDEASAIYLVPKKTSRNRHFVQYTEPKNRKTLVELKQHAEELGYDVMIGHIQEIQ